MTQTLANPTGYHLAAAGLRRIAIALETLPPGETSPYVSLAILPDKGDTDAETIAAVDAIALAVLGEVGAAEKCGSDWYHLVRGYVDGVSFEVQRSVSGPPDERDAELERLRAELASLKVQHARLDEQATGDPTGLTYSRETEADDPRPVSPARVPLHVGAREADGGELVDVPIGQFDQDAEDAAAFDRGFMTEHRRVTEGGLLDESEQEASTLSAAIRFSEARREAFRLAGRTTSERLLAATLDLLYDQALAEDAERTQRADLREGEQGRVTNPDLARFLAEKEEERRAVHYLDFGSDGEEDDRLACGKQVREVSWHTCNFAKVTCSVCVAAMAPVSEALR